MESDTPKSKNPKQEMSESEKDLISKFEDDSYFKATLCSIMTQGFNVLASQLKENNVLMKKQNELIKEAQ